MATWEDDYTRNKFTQVAGGMLYLASVLDELVKISDQDADLTILVNTRDWLRDRANVFSPPGEPEEGYSSEGAKIINLEAFRAWRQVR